MVNHELITLLTDEKLDIDAALRGSGDGIQQRFVRNEIWAGDRQPALCRVDERIEQAQVALVREAGSAWHDLAQHIKVEKWSATVKKVTLVAVTMAESLAFRAVG